jgi:hypothetical protein
MGTSYSQKILRHDAVTKMARAPSLAARSALVQQPEASAIVWSIQARDVDGAVDVMTERENAI